MAEIKKLTILGSTGTIGVKAVHLAKIHPERFKVTALAAGNNAGLLARQVADLKPELVSVKDEATAIELERLLGSSKDGARPEIVWGEAGLVRVATEEPVELVLSAVSGFAGLAPTLAAVRAGKTLALSNKESLVAGGELVMAEAAKNGAVILPVDSEHSAIHQSLAGHRRDEVRQIILTASGGPFRNKSLAELALVSPAQALDHPNWAMGDKVTIDSATLMNKGLELIEAMWLFGLSADMIKVVVHPQSIVHSAVEYIDGSVVAQLAVPDMTLPIAYALAWPERLDIGWIEPLDLIKIGRLDFEAPDLKRFPCLGLAMEAARRGGAAPIALNAADEIAVAAFLEAKIGLTDIPRIIQGVMDKAGSERITSLAEIKRSDALARQRAREMTGQTIDEMTEEITEKTTRTDSADRQISKADK